MTERYVVAIDQGTTSTRCIVFDRRGQLVSLAQQEHKQYFPKPGWVEHDAAEIWRNVERLAPHALHRAGITLDQVAAVGIANQRETTVVWDRRTGVPIGRALVWQDTRTDSLVNRLLTEPGAAEVQDRAALPLATYFSGPRLRWMLDHTPGLQKRAERGEVLFGTMETWLIWNLTGGLHVTDVTNASRTNLLDVHTLDWSPESLDFFGIPRAMLPEVRPSVAVFGTAAAGFPGVRIGFLLLNTGTELVRSDNGLLSTVAYQIGDEPAHYALEGSIAITGSLVQWFRDQLELIASAPEIETLARTVTDNGGCYIVPAFSGLYAPHWRSEARGVIVGLTSYITKGHLARAVLEATAWQTREVVDAMNADSGLAMTTLKVDGGMTADNLLMQYIADVLDVPVVRPLASETVSLGAAYAAGLAVGHWPDLADLRRNWHRAAQWMPAMDPAARDQEYDNWRRAVERTFDWIKPA
jgi:glycerol kinase